LLYLTGLNTFLIYLHSLYSVECILRRLNCTITDTRLQSTIQSHRRSALFYLVHVYLYCTVECTFWQAKWFGKDAEDLVLAMEFRSEKIPQNILGMASVILRKKELNPKHSEVYGRVNSEARKGRKWHKKISFTKNTAPNSESLIYFFLQNGIPSIFQNCGTVRNRILRVFCSAEWFRTEFREIASILFHGTEFRAIFSSEERFRTEF
jgi:hypothetical protein